MPRFDPTSVVEEPPRPPPEYDDAGYYNPDRDSFTTYEQAKRIALACHDPSLKIEEATIPKAVHGYESEDEPGEFRYHAVWTNGFKQTLAAIGREIDIREKRNPGQGIKLALRFIYDEMRATGYEVPDWVYDKVR